VLFNVVYIAALIVCACFILRLHPPDFAAMRNKIEASPSAEDLRPRALHAIDAVESADTVIARFHEISIRLIAMGIAWAAVNTLLLYFLGRRPRQL
jgi:hypothetical protein